MGIVYGGSAGTDASYVMGPFREGSLVDPPQSSYRRDNRTDASLEDRPCEIRTRDYIPLTECSRLLADIQDYTSWIREAGWYINREIIL